MIRRKIIKSIVHTFGKHFVVNQGLKKVQTDFNGDGSTSLTEAHAYVIIHSNTIDIPIKTSDVFLRSFSSFDPPKEESSIVGLIKMPNPLSGNDSNSSKRVVIQDEWLTN